MNKIEEALQLAEKTNKELRAQLNKMREHLEVIRRLSEGLLPIDDFKQLQLIHGEAHEALGRR